MTSTLNSANMHSCTCLDGALVGLFDNDPNLNPDPANTRLLDLTVADHNNAANKATAIDAAIRDLYVPEDKRRTASMLTSVRDICRRAGQDVYLSIERSDGGWFVGYSDTHGSVTETLPVTDTASDFVVKAWLDSNHNGVLDPGEDSREVDVHVFNLGNLKSWSTGISSTKVTGVASDNPPKVLYAGEDRYGNIAIDFGTGYRGG